MTFRFDRFRLDAENGRLDGPSGRLPLNFEASEVLRVLIEHRGRLVVGGGVVGAIAGRTMNP